MIQDTGKVEGHFRSDIFLAFLIGKSSNIVVYFIVGLGGLTHSCRSSQSFLHVRARSSSPISTFCCFFTYPLVMIISWPCRKKNKTRAIFLSPIRSSKILYFCSTNSVSGGPCLSLFSSFLIPPTTSFW